MDLLEITISATEKEEKDMKLPMFREFFICTIIPFLIPFITTISDEIICPWLKWVLFCLLVILDIIWAWQYYKRRKHEDYNAISAQIIRNAYSNAFTLNEQKRDQVINKSYDADYSIPKEMIPYDVHDYIGEICKNFPDTISQITEISKEHMAVTFIYHYVYADADEDSKSWRWVVGKEPTTRVNLNDFVGRDGSLYRFLTGNEGRRETFVFANDKARLADESRYYMSPRDKSHGKIGSVFASRVMFGNNASSFVEGILIVSTYGKKFLDNENQKYTENELRNILLEELFPYYQRLLETELGMLYLRHMAGRPKLEA